jgi:hypothetical protein
VIILKRYFEFIKKLWKKASNRQKDFVTHLTEGVILLVIVQTFIIPSIVYQLSNHPLSYISVFAVDYYHNKMGVSVPPSYSFTIYSSIRPIFSRGDLDPSNKTPIFFMRNLSSNERYYNILIHNSGNGIERNMLLDIDFSKVKALIETTEITSSRVEVTNKDSLGQWINLKIPELMPNEQQEIGLVVYGKDLPQINVWSESSGAIKNLAIYRVIMNLTATPV